MEEDSEECVEGSPSLPINLSLSRETEHSYTLVTEVDLLLTDMQQGASEAWDALSPSPKALEVWLTVDGLTSKDTCIVAKGCRRQSTLSVFPGE